MADIVFGPNSVFQFLALLAAGAWIYLIALHGGFWRAGPRLEDDRDRPGAATGSGRAAWPSVAAVVPARDEAAVIGQSTRSILRQDYAGALTLVVVDDRSQDGTADVARKAAAGEMRSGALRVIPSPPLAPGWTGKMWAVHQGVAEAAKAEPDYFWLTDADIEHGASELRLLMEKARAEKRDLVSVLVRLRCLALWEKFLIPAFVFFFQMLYPFPWANDPARRLAAAAGGSMLVRRAALERAGGIAAIRDELIDDCALARTIKNQGSIWIGHARETRSLRAYDRLSDIWDMVARTAFTQLRHSLPLLAGCLAGLALVYLMPPAAAIAGLAWDRPVLTVFGGATWLAMTAAYLPTLRLYG
ncbi:MAG: glycosyltransferase, partial [Alphaproteobacteria bacterium]